MLLGWVCAAMRAAGVTFPELYPVYSVFIDRGDSGMSPHVMLQILQSFIQLVGAWADHSLSRDADRIERDLFYQYCVAPQHNNIPNQLEYGARCLSPPSVSLFPCILLLPRFPLASCNLVLSPAPILVQPVCP